MNFDFKVTSLVNKGFLRKNICDGNVSGCDIFFTSICDNLCEHCIAKESMRRNKNAKPDLEAIKKTIKERQEGEVPFEFITLSGGEPLLFMDESIELCRWIKTNYPEIFLDITTTIPFVATKDLDKFDELLSILDSLKVSVQSKDPFDADWLRCTRSVFDRNKFYEEVLTKYKDKVIVAMNLVFPLNTKEKVTESVEYFSNLGFNVRINEVTGERFYKSFNDIMGAKVKSPYAHGCSVDVSDYFNVKTKVILRQKCYLANKAAKATFADRFKLFYKKVTRFKRKDEFAIIRFDGTISKSYLEI